ncbi:MAG: hypothetical protein F2681_08605 [Actinobacteria bacterium]|uniref:Unannotated protein n=1 Tax=freshwater metagenome TaxID=449393 RepID=A0A6J6RS32_9ZZZZ|nr:hypothetical protein [Actinomycetota bacterium]MSX93977.1 hypothetical protein [Actinomycetota bacterium]MSZ83187.1 hypothetical protein [Actinomycetota bacterium]MTB18015.1 hypothetical protein [Actinomycetota bacterium]
MSSTADPLETSPRSRRNRRNLIAVEVVAVLAIGATVIAIATADGNRSGSFHPAELPYIVDVLYPLQGAWPDP